MKIEDVIKSELKDLYNMKKRKPNSTKIDHMIHEAIMVRMRIKGKSEKVSIKELEKEMNLLKMMRKYKPNSTKIDHYITGLDTILNKVRNV